MTRQMDAADEFPSPPSPRSLAAVPDADDPRTDAQRACTSQLLPCPSDEEDACSMESVSLDGMSGTLKNAVNGFPNPCFDHAQKLRDLEALCDRRRRVVRMRIVRCCVCLWLGLSALVAIAVVGGIFAYATDVVKISFQWPKILLPAEPTDPLQNSPAFSKYPNIFQAASIGVDARRGRWGGVSREGYGDGELTPERDIADDTRHITSSEGDQVADGILYGESSGRDSDNDNYLNYDAPGHAFPPLETVPPFPVPRLPLNTPLPVTVVMPLTTTLSPPRVSSASERPAEVEVRGADGKFPSVNVSPIRIGTAFNGTLQTKLSDGSSQADTSTSVPTKSPSRAMSAVHATHSPPTPPTVVPATSVRPYVHTSTLPAPSSTQKLFRFPGYQPDLIVTRAPIRFNVADVMSPYDIKPGYPTHGESGSAEESSAKSTAVPLVLSTSSSTPVGERPRAHANVRASFIFNTGAATEDVGPEVGQQNGEVSTDDAGAEGGESQDDSPLGDYKK